MEDTLKFYLGLRSKAQVLRCKVPYCYSWRRLRLDGTGKDGLNGDWILDSGAFSELAIEGQYTVSIKQYAKAIKFFEPPVAVVMDWMCEPSIREKTGLTIMEHQRRTLDNWLELSNRINTSCTELMPVIQGWEYTDYLQHIEDYIRHGCPEQSYFGIGSICRRGDQTATKYIVKMLRAELPHARLHAFGLNTRTFSDPAIVHALESTDSMAWSYGGRRMRIKPCNDCHYSEEQWANSRCTNCTQFALAWRKRALRRIKLAKLQQVMTI